MKRIAFNNFLKLRRFHGLILYLADGQVIYDSLSSRALDDARKQYGYLRKTAAPGRA